MPEIITTKISQEQLKCHLEHTFGDMVKNVRPSAGNRGMEIQDEAVRRTVKDAAERLLLLKLSSTIRTVLNFQS